MKTCHKGLHQYEGKQCYECVRAHHSTPEWRAYQRQHFRKRFEDAYFRLRVRDLNRVRNSTPEYRAQRRAHYKTNSGPARSHSRRRRALKRLAYVEPFTPAQWQQVVDFYGHACAYCGGPYEHDDHHIPLAKGGADAIYNLVPACSSCNSTKQAKLWRLPIEHPWMYVQDQDVLARAS